MSRLVEAFDPPTSTNKNNYAIKEYKAMKKPIVTGKQYPFYRRDSPIRFKQPLQDMNKLRAMSGITETGLGVYNSDGSGMEVTHIIPDKVNTNETVLIGSSDINTSTSMIDDGNNNKDPNKGNNMESNVKVSEQCPRPPGLFIPIPTLKPLKELINYRSLQFKTTLNFVLSTIIIILTLLLFNCRMQ